MVRVEWSEYTVDQRNLNGSVLGLFHEATRTGALVLIWEFQATRYPGFYFASGNEPPAQTLHDAESRSNPVFREFSDSVKPGSPFRVERILKLAWGYS